LQGPTQSNLNLLSFKISFPTLAKKTKKENMLKLPFKEYKHAEKQRAKYNQRQVSHAKLRFINIDILLGLLQVLR
jgi:hypothetical protein